MRQPRLAELSAWVERLVALLVPEGVPPMSARVLGWLVVCEPAEQTADQIGRAIGHRPDGDRTLRVRQEGLTA